MHRPHRMAVGVLAGALLVSGCYGPFNLTRRLYQWNGQVSGKWEKEFVFILLAWVPVYSLTVLGDAVVFNSMEFWTGNNPVDAPGMMKSKHSAVPQTKRLVRGDAEAVLTYTPLSEGGRLLIEQFQQGQSTGRLQLEQRDGRSVATDADGHVLFTAETLGDGRVLVQDEEGRQLR